MRCLPLPTRLVIPEHASSASTSRGTVNEVLEGLHICPMQPHPGFVWVPEVRLQFVVARDTQFPWFPWIFLNGILNQEVIKIAFSYRPSPSVSKCFPKASQNY